MARSALDFIQFAAGRVVWSSQTQKQICREFKKLSNGIITFELMLNLIREN